MENEMIWRDIREADNSPVVGCRSEIIVGVDKDGLIGKTSYATGHYKGECWLLHTGEGLMEWNPIKWVPMPQPSQ